MRLGKVVDVKDEFFQLPSASDALHWAFPQKESVVGSFAFFPFLREKDHFFFTLALLYVRQDVGRERRMQVGTQTDTHIRSCLDLTKDIRTTIESLTVEEMSVVFTVLECILE